MVIVHVRAIISFSVKHSTLHSRYHHLLLLLFWEVLHDELTRRSKLITVCNLFIPDYGMLP